MRKNNLLCLIALLSLTSCQFENENSSDSSNTSDNSGNESSEVQDNTIEDAYDPTRPGYSDLDYDPDYTPSKPVDPDLTVIITIDENSPVTFKDGQKTKEVKPGTKFTEDDFDLSNSNGRGIQGVATLTEEGEVEYVYDLDSFAASKVNQTILPFFTPEAGFTALDIGSGSNSKFNYDQVPGSITANKTIKYESDVLVNGGENGYLEVGSAFKETSPITMNSAFRLDTKGQSLIDEQAVYEFHYNFENLGTEEIHLDGYQISSSSEYKGQVAYETRYRMDIDLLPGESITFKGQYLLGSNGNALSYFVADDDMSSMYLGMSMSMKKTDLTQPETVSQPEKNKTITVSLDLPTGVTVSGYETEIEAGSVIQTPQADQITNESGREILGWYIHSDPITLIESSTLAPNKDITISPYFKSEKGQSIYPGSGKPSALPDYFGVVDEEQKQLSDEKVTGFTSNPAIVNSELALNLKREEGLAKNNYFRLLSHTGEKDTSDGITAKASYKFHYSIFNNSSSTLSFTLYQVQSGTKIFDTGVTSQDVTIEPNSSKDVTLDFTANNSNTNAMTIFAFKEALASLDISILMAKENVTVIPVEKYALTLDAPSGVTFADNSTSISLEAGSSLPAINNTTDRIIAGYYVNGQEIDSSTFKMPAADTTIKPYFEARTGYTPLWLMSGKNNGVPGNTTGTVDTSKFASIGGTAGYDSIKDEYKCLVNGTDDYAEKGVHFTYAGLLKTGDSFRMDTKFKTEMKAGTHQFYFNIENFSSTSISFDCHMVNSAMNKTSATNNKFTFTLEGGKATTISITPTYSSGNGNALPLFEALTDFESNLDIGISMSVKYDVEA